MVESEAPGANASFASIRGHNVLAGNQIYGGIVTANFYGEERPETPPSPLALIPFCRDPHFVDRSDILDRINQRCFEPAGRIALVGLGGVGKSQLAIELAHRIAVSSDESWLFWIHAGTQARVEEGFRTIADAVKLPGRNQPKANIPQLISSWLSNERNGRWVIIIDSADDRDVFYATSKDSRDGRPLATYLPQCRNGSIVITTRDKDLATRLTGDYRNIIEVGPMEEAEALVLLDKKLGSTKDRTIATNLVRILDRVPLAISQAAAYIQARAPRSSLEKYLSEFRESERKRARLLGYDAGDLRRDGGASNSILTTWQISFDYIQSKRPSAAELLSLMSFFDRQGIPQTLLRPLKKVQDQTQATSLQGTEDSDSDSSHCHTDCNSDDDFEDDVAMLRAYCLITVNEKGDIFEMHGLVQLSMRKWLEASNESGSEVRFKQQFLERMARAFPTSDYGNWITCQKLFPHVEAAVNYKTGNDGWEDWAVLLYNGAWYARSQGRYEIAERMASKVMKSREKRLGKHDLATLASILLFAKIRQDQGVYKEAEKLFIQVMETRKTKLGADHPDTLMSMGNLATAFWNQGRWEEAEKLEVHVMETRKIKLGADHPDTLKSMANLASTYRDQGQWDKAEKLDVQVMETRKTELGADHPYTLTSMSNLALTLWNQGRWEEAEKLGVQVMETSKIKLGADHPDTLTNMANLASTFWDQGRWEEAEKLEVQVMETRKMKLGADHPDTLMSMGNLASTFWNQGRWEEAEKLGVQVMETSKMKLGADHPDTLISIGNLASTYRNQGRWEEAEKLGVQVMETSKMKLGPDHPSTLSCMGNLASTFWRQGRWEEAEKLEVQVVEASRIRLGADHPFTLTIMNNLASMLFDQGRWGEAEKLFIQVIETRKKKLGADHPDTLTSMNNLAYIWKGQSRDVEALDLLREVIQLRQHVLGPNHPHYISSLNALSHWEVEQVTGGVERIEIINS